MAFIGGRLILSLQPIMKRKRQIFSAAHKLTAVLMVIALLWLTVSTPFVNAAKQQQQTYANNLATDEETPSSDNNNPFGNTTEEKAESGSSNISEYLHQVHELVHPSRSLHKHCSSHDPGVYVAFHGELLCP